MKLSAHEIAEATDGQLLAGNGEINITHIATDTSKVREGSLFVPIIGARVDGHTFIEKALSDGAAAAFTSERPSSELLKRAQENGKAIISVKDTRAALQALGSYYRLSYVHIPYIGVTGSVGKTTTREMIACALSAGLNTYSTRGNANSQTGVPITVSETPTDAEIGVIEMGMSEPGEMPRLSKIVNCSMAVVTIIGVSHIANLGSQENIMKEKLHITDDMPDGAMLFLNGDDELLRDLSEDKLHEMGYCSGKSIKVRFYGTKDNAYYRAVNVTESAAGTEYDFELDKKIITHVKLSVPGIHMVLNSLAALAAAVENGVDAREASGRLSEFRSLNGRGQVTEKNGIRIINDAYNAAPQSMMAGLRVLNSTEPGEGGERIAVIADMLELGEDENKYHSEIGEFIINETKNIDRVLMYGNLTLNTFRTIKLLKKNDTVLETEHFEDLEDLGKRLCSIKKKGDVIFFKGSNSMKLWELAERLAQ